jgi:hypothetical protein
LQKNTASYSYVTLNITSVRSSDMLVLKYQVKHNSFTCTTTTLIATLFIYLQHVKR